jgi:hypothetical protein
MKNWERGKNCVIIRQIRLRQLRLGDLPTSTLFYYSTAYSLKHCFFASKLNYIFIEGSVNLSRERASKPVLSSLGLSFS